MLHPPERGSELHLAARPGVLKVRAALVKQRGWRAHGPAACRICSGARQVVHRVVEVGRHRKPPLQGGSPSAAG